MDRHCRRVNAETDEPKMKIIFMQISFLSRRDMLLTWVMQCSEFFADDFVFHLNEQQIK